MLPKFLDLRLLGECKFPWEDWGANSILTSLSYGCIIALSGIVNLLQPLIDVMNHEAFHDNPIPINIFLTSLGSLFGIALVIYVWMQGRRMEKEQETLVSERDRNRMIREEDESECVSFLDLRTS